MIRNLLEWRFIGSQVCRQGSPIERCQYLARAFNLCCYIEDGGREGEARSRNLTAFWKVWEVLGSGAS